MVADCAAAAGQVVSGFIDQNPAAAKLLLPPGTLVLDEVDFEPECSRGAHGTTLVVPAVGNNERRTLMAMRLQEMCAPPLIHPSAIVSPSSRLGCGSVVFAVAVVNANARIGEAAIVNTAAVVEHDCVLAEGVHVSPGAVLAGGVKVGRLSWIGAGAVVIPGVTVGAGSIVGAGSVVLRDVPDGATVVGNPARQLHRSG